MKAELILWAGLVIAPTAWALSQEANFALAPLACGAMAKPTLILISIISLALIAVSGLLSWTQLRLPVKDSVGQMIPVTPRRRGMALSGVLLSGLFFLVVLAQAIPNVMMVGCE